MRVAFPCPRPASASIVTSENTGPVQTKVLKRKRTPFTLKRIHLLVI